MNQWQIGAIADQTFTVTQQSPTLFQAILAVQSQHGLFTQLTCWTVNDKWCNFWAIYSKPDHCSHLHLGRKNSGGSDSELRLQSTNRLRTLVRLLIKHSQGSAITNIVATNTGGAVATWAIHPTLPAGLSMTNGDISDSNS